MLIMQSAVFHENIQYRHHLFLDSMENKPENDIHNFVGRKIYNVKFENLIGAQINGSMPFIKIASSENLNAHSNLQFFSSDVLQNSLRCSHESVYHLPSADHVELLLRLKDKNKTILLDDSLLGNNFDDTVSLIALNEKIKDKDFIVKETFLSVNVRWKNDLKVIKDISSDGNNENINEKQENKMLINQPETVMVRFAADNDDVSNIDESLRWEEDGFCVVFSDPVVCATYEANDITEELRKLQQLLDSLD